MKTKRDNFCENSIGSPVEKPVEIVHNRMNIWLYPRARGENLPDSGRKGASLVKNLDFVGSYPQNPENIKLFFQIKIPWKNQKERFLQTKNRIGILYGYSLDKNPHLGYAVFV